MTDVLPREPGVERPMLSRVAGSLYWLGRYVERAEHVARLLLEGQGMMTDVSELAPGAGAAAREHSWRAAPRVFDPRRFAVIAAAGFVLSFGGSAALARRGPGTADARTATATAATSPTSPNTAAPALAGAQALPAPPTAGTIASMYKRQIAIGDQS